MIKTFIAENIKLQISELIAAHLGLFFPDNKWNDLERGLIASAADLGFENNGAFINKLLSSEINSEQTGILSKHLTISETYFFRDLKLFDTLTKKIIPALIQNRSNSKKKLRFWCAGCSSGEEPYSLAILLKDTIPFIKEWDITILATDINNNGLNKARNGIYSEWSFRRPPPWLKEKYFENIAKNSYSIKNEIKEMVEFANLNLATDEFPSEENNTQNMDIIFCRNVLMYFSPELIYKIVKKFHNALIAKGLLIVSPVETSQFYFNDYKTININDVILYGKVPFLELPQQTKQEMNKNISLPDLQFPVEPEEKTKPPYVKIDTKVKDYLPNFIEETKKKETDKIKIKETEKDIFKEAELLFKNNKFAEAKVLLTEIINNNNTEHKAIALRARIYANEGKLSQALAECERVLKIDKLNPEYTFLYSSILIELAQPEEALKQLSKTIYLDHKHILAHFNAGNICKKLGKNGQSVKHYSNCLNILNTYKPDEYISDTEYLKAGELSSIIKNLTTTQLNNNIDL